jgi:signal transduction histidine kinase
MTQFLTSIGYTKTTLPRWDKLTPPEWRALDEEKLVQLRTEGIASPWEKEYIHKSGRRIPILIGAAQLDAESESCIAFIIDLTDRKAAEEEIGRLNGRLDQASRLSVMGEMVAGLAHEVHQPLAVIANYANGAARRLKQKKATVRELDQHLRDIAAESMRAAEVLRKIRQFIKRRDEAVSINTVIRDSLRLTQFDREEHQADRDGTRRRSTARLRRPDPDYSGDPESRIERPAGNGREPGTAPADHHQIGTDRRGRCPRFRRRHGPRCARREFVAHLRAILHDEAAGIGDGAFDQSFHRRSARRPASL